MRRMRLPNGVTTPAPSACPLFADQRAWLDRNPIQHFPALCGSFVQLNAQNLADRRYVASCAGNFSRFLGQGRRVTLSAGYR